MFASYLASQRLRQRGGENGVVGSSFVGSCTALGTVLASSSHVMSMAGRPSLYFCACFSQAVCEGSSPSGSPIRYVDGLGLGHFQDAFHHGAFSSPFVPLSVSDLRVDRKSPSPFLALSSTRWHGRRVRRAPSLRWKSLPDGPVGLLVSSPLSSLASGEGRFKVRPWAFLGAFVSGRIGLVFCLDRLAAVL